MSTPDDFTKLHIGKLTNEVKTTVTTQLRDLIADRASAARCHPSDLVRDALFLVFTGASYADHVANDRRIALTLEGRDQADTGACK